MNQEFKNKHHHISFKLALSGIIYTFTTQPNFKVMSFFALLALIFTYILDLSRLEMILIIWTIVIVFITEMINTSLESITDLITKEWRMEAKIAKDVSSGMVLISVIGASIVGIIIFLPKILAFF